MEVNRAGQNLWKFGTVLLRVITVSIDSNVVEF